MNDYKTYKANMSKIDGLNKVRNVIPININESELHLETKLKVCRLLRMKGFDFYCEAKFKSKTGRADIYLPQVDKVIEILCSEKEKQAILKSDKYPVSDIFFFKTGDDLNKIEEWLECE